MPKHTTQLYFIHCLSPVHIGIGEGVGLIDMPMMRERVTKWPLVPGSTVKGVHRDYFARNGEEAEWIEAVFGKAKGQGEDTSAGALVMTDGRILAFPVASYHGTFAYVTCPMVIKRFKRDMDAADVSISEPEYIHDWEHQLTSGEVDAIGGHGSELLQSGQKVYLDEFELLLKVEPTFDEWASDLAKLIFQDDSFSQQLLADRLLLVSDESFQYYVTQCSEIIDRISIEPNLKTVKEGALWQEEYMPTESILYGLIWCDQGSTIGAQDVWEKVSQSRVLQIGGNATIGKGRVRFAYSGGDR